MIAEYLDRGGLVARMEYYKGHTAEESGEHYAYSVALREIRNAPTADVAPVVHGRWISWEEADNPIPSPHWHECSVCHDAAQVLVNDIELLSGYCPNCGARMDGDDDGKAD